MNCKPGDLARVINSERAREAGIVDLIVRVTELSRNHWGAPSWRFEGPPRVHRCGEPITVIPDEMLRAICDPGDVAQDETLQWLPAPTTEEVTA